MKTSTLYRAEKQTGRTQRTSINKMEAIACGVQARFEESTGYSRRVTDATINVARALGMPETEIERWAAHRLTRLARDTERLREIESLLESFPGNGPKFCLSTISSATTIPTTSWRRQTRFRPVGAGHQFRSSAPLPASWKSLA